MNRVGKKIAAMVVGLAGVFNLAACNSSSKFQDFIKPESFRLSPHFVPLEERDILPLKQNKRATIYAVSCNYILRTGIVHMSDNNSYNNQYIDWSADDSFIRALHTIRDNTQTRISHASILQKLLQKNFWDLEDRAVWEKKVSNIIADETLKISGLDNYRSYTNKNWENENLCLNRLAEDIDRHTESHENDCKAMSVVRGIEMQIEDNIFLPPEAPVGSFKKRMNYYLVTGGMSINNNHKGGGHCFIFTPAHRLLEATRFNDDYIEPSVPCGLEAFIRGAPFVADDGTVYGDFDCSLHKSFRERAAREASGAQEGDRKFSKDELQTRGNIKGNALLELDDRKFIALASRPHKTGEVYEVKLYAQHDIGSPQKGYVMVGFKAAPAAAAESLSLTAIFHDNLSDESFRVLASFDGNGNRLEIDQEVGKALKKTPAYHWLPLAQNQTEYAPPNPAVAGIQP